MADHSAIEWTDATWNPVRGCVKVSPGCAHCYAETFAERFRGVPGHPYEQGFDLRLVPEQLAAPLSWKKPRRVFVNSMSDLFQDGVPDAYIDQVFAVMALAPEHTFQVLTKRPDRMRAYMEDSAPLHDGRVEHYFIECMAASHMGAATWPGWPLPNVWLGVSVENKRTRDERIPALLKTPAAVRFISAEPLLEEIASDEMFSAYCATGWTEPPYDDKLDWVIVGGESGPGARPFDLRWARAIVTVCRQYNVPVFVKQLGANRIMRASDLVERAPTGKAHDPAAWPEDLRVREWPAVRA